MNHMHQMNKPGLINEPNKSTLVEVDDTAPGTMTKPGLINEPHKSILVEIYVVH